MTRSAAAFTAQSRRQVRLYRAAPDDMFFPRIYDAAQAQEKTAETARTRSTNGEGRAAGVDYGGAGSCRGGGLQWGVGFQPGVVMSAPRFGSK